jgi:hypothetical protein
MTLDKVFRVLDKKVLGKEAVADVLFAEPSLPSVTLGKHFAECFLGFAECFRHSAKRPISVVEGQKHKNEHLKLKTYK